MKKLIYIADDEKEILDAIQIFVENAGYEVQTFLTGDSLYYHFLEHPADLVILDIMMPGTNGLTICSQLREISDIPIIIVSAKNNEMDKVKAFSLGGDDYMVKPFSPVELIARIHSIFRRIDRNNQGKSSKTISYGDISINTEDRQIYIKGENIDATPTEYDFFLYMINYPEKAISREELLKNVWQMEIEVGLRVTDDLVKRLRKKMINAGSEARIETVWGYGFKLTVSKDY